MDRPEAINGRRGGNFARLSHIGQSASVVPRPFEEGVRIARVPPIGAERRRDHHHAANALYIDRDTRRTNGDR